MLDDIREKKTSLSTYILVGAAGIGMLFLGVPFFAADRGITVATVNGEDITTQEFAQATRRASPQATQRDILGSLISNRLINEHVAHSGFVYPQQKLYDLLRKRFDGNNKLYQVFLDENGYTAKGYERSLRRSLATQSYLQMLTSSQFIVQGVSDQLLANLVAKRDLDIVKLPLAPILAKTTVSTEEAQQFYQQHQDQYRTQPSVTLSYVLFDADTLVDASQITQAQIDEYAEKHSENKLRAGEYLLFDQAKDAESAAQQIHSGKTFADITAEIDKKALGGEYGKLDLHANGHGVSKKADKVLFELKKVGDISPVFETEYGSMIVKLDQIEHKGDDLSAEQLRTAAAKDIAQERYHDVSNKAFDAAGNNKTLPEIAGILGIAKLNTITVTPKSGQPDWLKNDSLMKQLFGEDKVAAGKAGTPIALNDHSSLFFTIDARTEPTIPPFEQVQQQAETDARQAKAEQALNDEAQRLMAQWQKEGSLNAETLASASGSLQTFNAVNQPSEMKNVPESIALAAILQDKLIQSQAQDDNRYIIKLNGLHIGSPEHLSSAEKTQWQEQWQQIQTQVLQNNLNDWLHKQGSITINPLYLQ